jgi:hypothetical protein
VKASDDLEESKEPVSKRAKLSEDAITREEKVKAGSIDIQKEIDAELEAVKTASRIFFVFDMSVPGVVFIKLVDWMRPHIDVKRVGQAIVEQVVESKEALTRFACRFMPVDILCKANLEDFKKFATPAIERVFNEASGADAKSILWCMEFKRRNNDKVLRKDYFDLLQSIVHGFGHHPISYDNADQEVVVEVFRDMLVFALLPRYKHYKKYNLQMLSG